MFLFQKINNIYPFFEYYKNKETIIDVQIDLTVLYRANIFLKCDCVRTCSILTNKNIDCIVFE